MELLAVAEFEVLLQKQGNIHRNPHGVEIDFVEEISAWLRIWAESPTSFDLYLDMPAAEFMKELDIRGWDDVDAIDEAVLWEQYKRGNGYIWANLEYLGDAELCFRIMNGKTVIIAEQLGYHDEVAEIIDDVKGLRDYVRDHIRDLYIAIEGTAQGGE